MQHSFAGTPVRALAVIVATLGVAAVLSGCTVDDAFGDGAEPLAVLDVEDDSMFVGEAFRFSAEESRDPNGKIVRYTFDFGDGQTETIEAGDAGGEGNESGNQSGNETSRGDGTSIEHSYSEPGEYTVTLTVTDDGKDQGKARSATDEIDVAVNDQDNITAFVAQSPVPALPSENFSHAFEVGDGADRFNGTFDVVGGAPLGDSEIEISVVGPEGDEVANETVTVGANDNQSVALEGGLAGPGTYEIRILARSGAADVTGDFQVLYDDPIEGGMAADEPSGNETADNRTTTFWGR